MNTYAIFLDIDGTLTSCGSIPQRNINAIREARKNGHKVFINTGRSYGFIPEFVFEQAEFDGFVAGIGSHVICGKTELKRVFINENELYSIADKYLNAVSEIIFEGETVSAGFNCDRNNVEFILEKPEDIFKLSEYRFTKVFLGGVLPETEQNKLSEKYTFFQHHGYSEFAQKGCSKANGIELVLKHLDIPRERSIAVGDSVNDLDMLAYAGISVAMGNASDEIKSLCTYVTESNENGGVGAIIERLLLNK